MAIPAGTLHEAAGRHRSSRMLRAARIIHPFPTLLNVGATCALAFVAVRGLPNAGILARMLLTMLFAQSAIGVVNDIWDERLDAATKPWKPIPAGVVSARAARVIAAALLAAAVALATTLGPGGFALAMLGMSCGLAYDVRLKGSIFSAVPYMIAIPTLPIWVWVTLGEWSGVLLWLVPLGALLGLSLHLANTLPDIDDDRAQGIEGFAHRLGAGRSMLVAWAAFALALLLSAASAPVLHYDARVYGVTLLAGLACLAASAAVFVIRRDSSALRFGFGALAVGSAGLAVGWLAAVT